MSALHPRTASTLMEVIPIIQFTGANHENSINQFVTNRQVLTGCSKDAEVNAFIAGATKEIVSPTPPQPTCKRHKKPSTTAKPNSPPNGTPSRTQKGIWVTAETKRKLEESIQNNMKALTEVSLRNMRQMATYRGASSKFQRLMTEFGRTFQA